MERASKRLKLFIGVYMAVFALLAAIGYYAGGSLLHDKRHDYKPVTFASDLTYLDLPRMTVNLANNSQHSQARLDISLEIAKKDLPYVEGYKSVMMDRLNSFLANADPSWVNGENKNKWLHAQMLKQINDVGAPAPVHDVFLRQLLFM